MGSGCVPPSRRQHFKGASAELAKWLRSVSSHRSACKLVFAHDIDQHVHVHADGTSMYLSCFFLPNALNILNQMKFLVALAGQLLNSCLDHARAVPDFWNWCA